jgi:hypothetical protein
MLYQWIRLLRGDNGVITDKSLANQDEAAAVVHDIVAAEDAIYLGQHFPFNNFYYKRSVANALPSDIIIEYWDSNEWVMAVDILDGTKNGTATLSKSGVIQFSPNRNNRWQIVYDTTDASAPSDLSSVTIYNMYWIRVRFTGDLTATAASKKFCYCFSSHQQIDNRDSTLSSYLTAFGVTTWEDYIINASIDVVSDLKRMNLIIDRGQILKLEDVSIATDWKTIQGLYFELGGDYQQKYQNAVRRYEEAIDLKAFTFDLNKNALVEPVEVDRCQSRMSRR